MKAALLIFFCLAQSHAAIPVQVQTPETEVEISVFDLAKKRPPAPKLPADYGSRVAQALEGQRGKLTACIGDEDKHAFAIEMKIAGNGRGEVEPEKESDGKIWKCVSEILSATVFPPHPLPKAVTVKFPLSLERKKI